ncbi:MAG: sodium-independent anion transporter, partial [Roseiarcus sp.]
LVVDDDEVVRDRRPADASNEQFLFYDLEGELFFGAAPELDRIFRKIEQRVCSGGVRDVLLRLKRVRNPDVVSLERLEHFLRDAEQQDIVVWLAGVQPDLLAAFRRLNFGAWLPSDRVFPQGVDEDSATLAAIRRIRAGRPAQTTGSPDELYYLV